MTKRLMLFTLVSLFLLAGCFLPGASLEEVARSETRWTGVAVSAKGRIFVNFPRWSDIPFSVAEIVDGRMVPYPDANWNSWRDGLPVAERFVCVQSVHIDGDDTLWVLDAGASLRTGVIQGAPKLVKIDLASNSVVRTFRFDESVVSGAGYLNDVRVDTKLRYAYMTESGSGSLIVMDLSSGAARRLLSAHPSTRAEDIDLNVNGRSVKFPVHADGIALTRDGKTVYYKALTGHALYRIPASVLRDPSLTAEQVGERVEFVARTLPSDAIEFGRDGDLYFSAIEKNAIYRLTPNGEFRLLIADERLTWPDSFAVDAFGRVFVTTSGILFPKTPHYLFRLKEK